MTAESQPAPASPLAENESAAKPRIFQIALVAAIVWILGLVTLAIVSANPVTLNILQIEQSDYVVTATRTGPDANTIEVSREWKRGEELGTITVTNLDDARMPADGEFLLPLNKLSSGRYSITPTALPNKAPLIYPTTEEAMNQLETILKQLRK